MRQWFQLSWLFALARRSRRRQETARTHKDTTAQRKAASKSRNLRPFFGPSCLCVSLLFLAVFSTGVQAQTARITGTTVDSSGALVVGAGVRLVGAGDATIASTKSGPDGAFT